MMKVMIMSVMLIATTTASFYGDAAGNIYVGMMLASQSNMNNTDTDCFVAAQATNEEIAFTFDELDPSVILNNFQVLQIKLSTTRLVLLNVPVINRTLSYGELLFSELFLETAIHHSSGLA